MNTVVNTFLVFLIAATMQNLVLTAGFDSSVMLKIHRNPRQLFRFDVLVLCFSVITTAIFYPIDRLLGAVWWVRMLRPLIIIGIVCLLYLIAIVVLHLVPTLYRRVRHLLPLAFFNNLVVGVALLLNLQVSVSFFSALGLAAGAALGFGFLSAMTAEATERMDNPDIPSSFRGLPATLVYLGLLALALMGFSPVFHFV